MVLKRRLRIVVRGSGVDETSVGLLGGAQGS